MLSKKEQQLLDALAPRAEQEGVEIVTVEVAGAKKAPTIRVYIDTPDGVSFDELSSAQAWINDLMDELDPFPGAYTLEVSSPGIDRPLRTAEHFARFVGDTAVLKTQPVDGRGWQLTGARIGGGRRGRARRGRRRGAHPYGHHQTRPSEGHDRFRLADEHLRKGSEDVASSELIEALQALAHERKIDEFYHRTPRGIARQELPAHPRSRVGRPRDHRPPDGPHLRVRAGAGGRARRGDRRVQRVRGARRHPDDAASPRRTPRASSRPSCARKPAVSPSTKSSRTAWATS